MGSCLLKTEAGIAVRICNGADARTTMFANPLTLCMRLGSNLAEDECMLIATSFLEPNVLHPIAP